MTPSLGSAESRNSTSNEVVMEIKESKIVIEFPKNVGKRVVFFGKHILTIKKGKIRIKKSSLMGKKILKAISLGKKPVLDNSTWKEDFYNFRWQKINFT